MEKTDQSAFYPISLDAVTEGAARANGRNRTPPFSRGGADQLALFRGGNVRKEVNEFGEEITRVDGGIPPDLPVADGDRFLFISYDQSALTHGLHKYPAKFFPELPRWLIQRYSRGGDTVLDPFLGSGTTNVEALLLGRNSVGIDVDPFSRFLSKVKATALPGDELRASQRGLLRSILAYSPSEVAEGDIPMFPYRDRWFNREIVLELTYLRKAVQSLDAPDAVRDFFRVCLSSIIRAVSNADDNCTRTVIRKKLNKKVAPGDALRRFARALLVGLPKMLEFSRRCPKGVSVAFPDDMDARSIGYQESTFDLAVTSPPYANAVDYPRTHQLEMYWLGLASGSLTPLKRQHVGTESVLARDYDRLHRIGVAEADAVISRIFTDDRRRAYIAFKYLDDMRKNLAEVHRVLRPGGKYVIAVGNNRIRGQLFENWRYIMRLAEITGFAIETYFASEIINHFIKVPREERIATDWILVLAK